MATPDEVLQLVEELIEDTQNPELSERQLNQMCEAFAEVEASTLRAAARRHVFRSVFFPKLAEMNRLIEEEKLSRRSHLLVVNTDLDLAAEVAEFERIQREMEEQADWPICEACAGAGYVVRLPTDELVTLGYWRGLMGKGVPCGEPTDDCPWEKCQECGGLGKQRAPQPFNRNLQVTATEPEKVRTA